MDVMVTTRHRISEAVGLLLVGTVFAALTAYALETDPTVGSFGTVTACASPVHYPCADPAGSDLSMIGSDGLMHEGCTVVLTGPDTSHLTCRDGFTDTLQ